MRTLVQGIMFVAVVCFFLLLDRGGRNARVLPEAVQAAPILVRADTQKEIYAIYKKVGLWGASVVHMNRFMNMVDYFPKEESLSRPFPIAVGDIRPSYEQGLDSHNWLFIANRTGLVRTVTVLFPLSVLKERMSDFAGNFAYSVDGDRIRGYTYDMPIMIATLPSVPATREPVIVNVDAGYFEWEDDLPGIALNLQEKFPDIRLIVFCSSTDKTEIDNVSRQRLTAFENLWVNKQ